MRYRKPINIALLLLMSVLASGHLCAGQVELRLELTAEKPSYVALKSDKGMMIFQRELWKPMAFITAEGKGFNVVDLLFYTSSIENKSPGYWAAPGNWENLISTHEIRHEGPCKTVLIEGTFNGVKKQAYVTMYSDEPVIYVVNQMVCAGDKAVSVQYDFQYTYINANSSDGMYASEVVLDGNAHTLQTPGSAREYAYFYRPGANACYAVIFAPQSRQRKVGIPMQFHVAEQGAELALNKDTGDPLSPGDIWEQRYAIYWNDGKKLSEVQALSSEVKGGKRNNLFYPPWEDVSSKKSDVKTGKPVRQNDSPPVLPVPGTAPVMDGNLNDAVWQKALLIKNFVLNNKPVKAAAQTEVRLFVHAAVLYVAFTCYEDDMTKLRRFEKEHDGTVWTDDSVEIFIDANLDRKTYRHLVANSIGATYDAIMIENKRDTTRSAWNPGWTVVPGRFPGAWTLEIAIPFSELSLTPDVNTVWGINLCRNDYVRGEYSTWICTYGSFHNAAMFAPVNIPGINPRDYCNAAYYKPFEDSLMRVRKEIDSLSQGLSGLKGETGRLIDMRQKLAEAAKTLAGITEDMDGRKQKKERYENLESSLNSVVESARSITMQFESQIFNYYLLQNTSTTTKKENPVFKEILFEGEKPLEWFADMKTGVWYESRLIYVLKNEKGMNFKGCIVLPIPSAKFRSIAVTDEYTQPVQFQSDDLDGDGFIDEVVILMNLAAGEEKKVYVYCRPGDEKATLPVDESGAMKVWTESIGEWISDPVPPVVNVSEQGYAPSHSNDTVLKERVIPALMKQDEAFVIGTDAHTVWVGKRSGLIQRLVPVKAAFGGSYFNEYGIYPREAKVRLAAQGPLRVILEVDGPVKRRLLIFRDGRIESINHLEPDKVSSFDLLISKWTYPELMPADGRESRHYSEYVEAVIDRNRLGYYRNDTDVLLLDGEGAFFHKEVIRYYSGEWGMALAKEIASRRGININTSPHETFKEIGESGTPVIGGIVGIISIVPQQRDFNLIYRFDKFLPNGYYDGKGNIAVALAGHERINGSPCFFVNLSEGKYVRDEDSILRGDVRLRGITAESITLGDNENVPVSEGGFAVKFQPLNERIKLGLKTSQGMVSFEKHIGLLEPLSCEINPLLTRVTRIFPNRIYGHELRPCVIAAPNPHMASLLLKVRNNSSMKRKVRVDIANVPWMAGTFLRYNESVTNIPLPAEIDIQGNAEVAAKIYIQINEDSLGLLEGGITLSEGSLKITDFPLKVEVRPNIPIMGDSNFDTLTPALQRQLGMTGSYVWLVAALHHWGGPPPADRNLEFDAKVETARKLAEDEGLINENMSNYTTRLSLRPGNYVDMNEDQRKVAIAQLGAREKTITGIKEEDYLNLLKAAMHMLSSVMDKYSGIWWVADEMDERLMKDRTCTVEELNKQYDAVAGETIHPLWQNFTYFGIRDGFHRLCKADIIGFHFYGPDKSIHTYAPKLAADRGEMQKKWWAEKKNGVGMPPISGRPLLRVCISAAVRDTDYARMLRQAWYLRSQGIDAIAYWSIHSGLFIYPSNGIGFWALVPSGESDKYGLTDRAFALRDTSEDMGLITELNLLEELLWEKTGKLLRDSVPEAEKLRNEAFLIAEGNKFPDARRRIKEAMSLCRKELVKITAK